ncbi:NAD(P)/FAD-dependent oxidoreductase [Nonomuraea typhae]|uniref:NAD(P)/FAD-dependent oxidoreductase n=1 Tax=Nonomuraea typhae TaxID=2603600 RepID=A0ABW7YST4_9ACTN
MYDVTIVGAGPAGASAALLLARARRRVLVLDTGEGRNSASRGVHLLLSREGSEPARLRRESWEQLSPYPDLDTRRIAAVTAAGERDGFEVTLADGDVVASRRLLLATGVRDLLPPVDGLAEHWGRSAFLCPYCDGWEARDQAMGTLITDAESLHFADRLLRWSGDLSAFRHGAFAIPGEQRDRLRAAGLTVYDSPVARVRGVEGRMKEVVLADGTVVACSALFVHPETEQRSGLARELGCTVLEDDSVEIDFANATSVPGVYAAGDMARTAYQPTPIAYVAAAATSGLVAATFIDTDLYGSTG